MNQGVWVGALALCLGSWVAEATAQDASWRSVMRLPTAPSQPGSGPHQASSASLGRPVAITTRAAGSDPDWADHNARHSPPLAALAGRSGSREEPRLPQPGEVIAASAPVSTAPTTVVTAGGSGIPDSSPVPIESEVPIPGPPLEEPVLDSFASERPWGAPPITPASAAGMPPPPVGPSMVPTGPAVPDPPRPGNWGHPQPPPPQPTPPPVLDDAPGGPAPRFYVSAEYLLWWARRDHVPPLVTTSEAGDAGILDRPSTMVLFGGSLNRDPRSGGRFTVGTWLDDCQKKGIEVSGFFLGERSTRAMFSSAQFPVLARPFQEINRGNENVQLVGFPGAVTGRVGIEAPSSLWGLDTNYRCCLSSCCDRSVNLLGGFRYLNLKESITITENLVNNATVPPPLTNTSGVVFDTFATRNQFYGGQMGIESRWLHGPWSLDLRGKLALGVTHQEIDINGGQRITNLTTGVTNNFQGGLLALPGANIGTFNRDRFSVVPEVGVSLGYQVTPNLRASVGYNFLYWSNVVRPGDQIDRVVDVTRIPNFVIPPGVTPRTDQIRPMVPFKETDFWAQGLNVGLELSW